MIKCLLLAGLFVQISSASSLDYLATETTFRGNWSVGTEYTINDVVALNGQVFVKLQTNYPKGGIPPASLNWYQIIYKTIDENAVALFPTGDGDETVTKIPNTQLSTREIIEVAVVVILAGALGFCLTLLYFFFVHPKYSGEE